MARLRPSWLHNRIGIPVFGLALFGAAVVVWQANQPKRTARDGHRGFNKLKMLAREADLPTPEALDQKVIDDTVTLADLKTYQARGQDPEIVVLRLISENKLESYKRLVNEGWKTDNKLRSDDLLLASIPKPEFLKWTLAMGANPEGYYVPRLPLAFAASNPAYLESMRLLVASGADINALSREQRGIGGGKPVLASILLVAMSRSNKVGVQYLLKAGAEWKIRDSIGRYPLEIIRDRTLQRNDRDPSEPYRMMITQLVESQVITQTQANEALTPPRGRSREVAPRITSDDASSLSEPERTEAPNGKWISAQ